jgi:hypothetical protein
MTDEPGRIAWVDLTVPDAPAIRDFYASVAGWSFEPVGMGDYSDFNMVPPGGTKPVAGVCHKRGPNANLPSQWLIYVTVDEVDAAVARAKARGGTVVDGPRALDSARRFVVVRDPAGAFVGLVGA